MSDVVCCWKVRLTERVGAPTGGAPTSGKSDQLPPWVSTTLSRLRMKPLPVTWLQQCMP